MDMVTVPTPTWKFEWNLNTLVSLIGFIGIFFAWGATWNQVQSEMRANSAAIERLDKRLTAAEVALRTLDTQEIRIAGVEKQASEAAVSMRSLESTLNTLGSDIRVVREILQRIEGDRPPPTSIR
ncbi:membrane protein [Rhizobium sp. LC145]|nr:membrane protein [Rhizobium sp. LC145]